MKDLEQMELRECVLLVNPESFVFSFTVQKYKGQNIQNYNFTSCLI